MSVEFYRESPGKLDSRTLNRKTLDRWTGRMIQLVCGQKPPQDLSRMQAKGLAGASSRSLSAGRFQGSLTYII